MQPSSAYTLVQLTNGTHSVHSLAFGETFHPVIGPAAEAEALYVRQLRLAERFAQHQGEFVIWDVGLGAAANALGALRAGRQVPGQVRLISFDQTLEPLQFAVRHATALGYFAEYEPVVGALAEGWERVLQFQNGEQRATWELHLGDFPALLAESGAAQFAKPHAILFDAYSPATNPAMWTQPLFARIFELLDPQRPCALPTYSRSTMLRVTLLMAGFFVGKGHATGEKEETTIAANSPELILEPLDQRWLSRARISSSAEPLWQPAYSQAPLTARSWEKLRAHPQFR